MAQQQEAPVTPAPTTGEGVQGWPIVLIVATRCIPCSETLSKRNRSCTCFAVTIFLIASDALDATCSHACPTVSLKPKALIFSHCANT
ncbi:uncharacterized protein IUM83_08074 [Phytophthora cinnamomi]|uniref:uncharacterized protein n=1 Tax=Phytophthora cinnamomi TaxID=4785 RepID=UPI00355AA043|nr:hypothetical protein IUM83_08074 [Phytophthora cinnamomi]